MDNPNTTDLFEKPSHSSRGILSFALPFLVLCGVSSLLTSLMSTRLGSLFLYCISPALLLTGVILSTSELRNKKRNRLFPALGLMIALLAVVPMVFVWLLGLMQGAPFSCLDNPSFCGW